MGSGEPDMGTGEPEPAAVKLLQGSTVYERLLPEVRKLNVHFSPFVGQNAWGLIALGVLWLRLSAIPSDFFMREPTLLLKCKLLFLIFRSRFRFSRFRATFVVRCPLFFPIIVDFYYFSAF